MTSLVGYEDKKPLDISDYDLNDYGICDNSKSGEGIFFMILLLMLLLVLLELFL